MNIELFAQSESSRIQFQHETLPSLSYFPRPTRTIREHDQNETRNRERDTRPSEFLSDIILLYKITQNLTSQTNRVDNENYKLWNCFQMKLSGGMLGLAWSRTQTFSALFSPPKQPPLITTTPRPTITPCSTTTPIHLRGLSALNTRCLISTQPNHGSPNPPSSSKPVPQRFVTSLSPYYLPCASNTYYRHAYPQNTPSHTLYPPPEPPNRVH